MSENNENSKLVIAGVVGGIAGLILGAYFWGKSEKQKPISSNLKTITKAIEQLEGINTKDSINLREELKTLLLNLNEHYGKSEK